VRRYPAAAALLGVVALAIGCSGSSEHITTASTRSEPIDPRKVVLRLGDIRGYQAGDDYGYTDLLDDPPRPLVDAVRAAGPYRAYSALFERVVTPTKLKDVNSLVAVFSGPAAARRVLEAGDVLVTSYATGVGGGNPPEELDDHPRIGDEVRAFTSRGGHGGYALVWQQGSVVAFVVAGGVSEEAGRQQVTPLAQLVARRIANA